MTETTTKTCIDKEKRGHGGYSHVFFFIYIIIRNYPTRLM